MLNKSFKNSLLMRVVINMWFTWTFCHRLALVWLSILINPNSTSSTDRGPLPCSRVTMSTFQISDYKHLQFTNSTVINLHVHVKSVYNKWCIITVLKIMMLNVFMKKKMQILTFPLCNIWKFSLEFFLFVHYKCKQHFCFSYMKCPDSYYTVPFLHEWGPELWKHPVWRTLSQSYRHSRLG